MAFYYSKWLALPITVRHELAQAFNINKTGPTHVDTNRVVSDGYNMEAVESILTIDNLQSFLDTEEKDEDTLFEMLVSRGTPAPEGFAEKVEEPVQEEKPEKVEHIVAKPAPAPEPKKKGRPAKK